MLTITWRALDKQGEEHTFKTNVWNSMKTMKEMKVIIRNAINQYHRLFAMESKVIDIEWPKVGDKNWAPLKWHKMGIDKSAITDRFLV